MAIDFVIVTVFLARERGTANGTEVAIGFVGLASTGAHPSGRMLVKHFRVSEIRATIMALKLGAGVSSRPAVVLSGFIPGREAFATRSAPVHDY